MSLCSSETSADALLVAGHAREFIAVRCQVGLPCSPAAPVLGLAAAGVAGCAADESSAAIAALDHRLRGDGVAAPAVSRCTLSFSARSDSTCDKRSSGSVLASANDSTEVAFCQRAQH